MPALALANLPVTGQGKGYGGYRSFGSVGSMTAALILPAILAFILPIALVAAIMMPLSLFFIFNLEQPATRTGSEEVSFQAKMPSLLYWFLAAHFLVSLTSPAITGFYNSFALTLGSPLEWIGVISALNGFIGFIILPLMGSLSDLYGYPTMFRIISALTACSLIFLVFVLRSPRHRVPESIIQLFFLP